MGNIVPIDLQKYATINQVLESSTYESDYWVVSIPDLPPSTSVPLQFAWVFEDDKVGDYSAYKVFETPGPLNTEVANITTAWIGSTLYIYFDSTLTNVTDYVVTLTPTTGEPITISEPRNQSKVAQVITLSQQKQEANYGSGNFKKYFSGLIQSKNPDGLTLGKSFVTATQDDGITGTDISDSSWSLTATDGGYIVAWALTPTQLNGKSYDYGEVWVSSTQGGTYSKRAIDKSPISIQGVSNTEYVKIRYSTISGSTSNFSNPKSVTPYSPVTVDTTGPGNVTSVTTSGGIESGGTVGFNGYADISWPAVSGGGIRGYRIRYKASGSSNYSYADSPGTGTSYRLTGLGVGLTYNIAVATYDEYNNTSTSYISGSDVAISGTPFIANTVNVSGYFNATSGSDTGAFKFGYGVDTGKRGLVFNSSNYWYIDSNASASLKVGGSTANYLEWNGTKLTVDGDVNAKGGTFSGNILLSTSGGSIYNGTITGSTLTGDGFALNSTGLAVKKGSNAVTISSTDGSISANYGTIAGWTIDANSINKGNQVGFYAPSSPVSSDVVIWSGGTRASNKFNVTYGGKLTATEVDINGKITATSGFIGTVGGNGWTINSNALQSTGTGGSISGGIITGTTITGSSFETEASVYGQLKIQYGLISSANFIDLTAPSVTAPGLVLSSSASSLGPNGSYRIQFNTVTDASNRAPGVYLWGMGNDPSRNTSDSSTVAASLAYDAGGRLVKGRTIFQGAAASATAVNNLVLGDVGDIYLSTA